MKYSRKAEELVNLTARGLSSKELAKLGVNPKTLVRLVRAGIIKRTKLPQVGRGHAGFLYVSVKPAPKPKLPEKRLRNRSIMHAIAGAVAAAESGIAEISAAVGKPSNEISGTLLRMCEIGLLVRRRVGGDISGKTSKRDFYLYRCA